MRVNLNYTRIQKVVLVGIRLIIGYHFLFEGMDKLFKPNWSSVGFLVQSNWVFSDVFNFMANNASLVGAIDFINIWGQILIGLSLILGLYAKWGAYAGALLLFLYYIAVPPFVGGASFIDKNLFELLLFLITAYFPTSKIIGLEILIKNIKK